MISKQSIPFAPSNGGLSTDENFFEKPFVVPKLDRKTGSHSFNFRSFLYWNMRRRATVSIAKSIASVICKTTYYI